MPIINQLWTYNLLLKFDWNSKKGRQLNRFFEEKFFSPISKIGSPPPPSAEKYGK